MSYLILGGTGTVGSALASEFVSRGKSVTVMTRSEEKIADLPDGIDGVAADMTDPLTFEGTFDGHEGLFLLNPVSQSELQEGLFALEEAKRAGLRHIVYMSVHNVESGPHLPHFASKIAIEDAIRKSGITYTILRPNNFYQNDFWWKDAIVQYGVYPQPLGSAGVSRVDVRDISDAAANAFTEDGHENETYALNGPDALTGADCARVFSDVMGREINYGGDDLDAWEQQFRQFLPAWMVYDFRLMYDVFQKEGFSATDEQMDGNRKILGKEPRSFNAFVSEVASDW